VVGTIVFKDFETGSYKNMRIVVYNGFSYEDIGKGDFVSCRVNPDESSIDYDISPLAGAPDPGMTNILYIAQEARKYLWKNPYVTSAEYCFNYGECKLRPLSFKTGVYAPPDFHTLFNDGGFYALVASFADKTNLWRSVLCEGIDFAVRRVLDVSDKIFTCTGYGIYINAALFSKRLLGSLNIPSAICKRAGKKNVKKLNLKKFHRAFLCTHTTPVSHPVGKIVHLLSSFKVQCANRLEVLMEDIDSQKRGIKCIFTLAEDEEILRLTDEFVQELRDFSMNWFDYGYIAARSHVDMLTLRETLSLNADIKLSDTIAAEVKARSVNMKFMNKLPCAPFYDSDGTAIWE